MDNPQKSTAKAFEHDLITDEVDTDCASVNELSIIDDEGAASIFAKQEPEQAVSFISEMLFELRRCAAAQNLSHLVYFIEMAILETTELQKKPMARDQVNNKTA